MAQPTKPPANGFVAFCRKIYNPIGFSKGYNFILFFIFGGALMGFSLARMPYLDYWGTFKPAKRNEKYYFQGDHVQAGMMLHLFTVLPASFLVCFQFVPAIRHRAMLLHRVNGYLIILLSLASTVGAFMIARVAAGGTVDTQTATGFLGIVFVGALAMSYYNVKRLQIEQHRAWMLRAWAYAGSIVTMRLIFVAMIFINSARGYSTVRECSQIDYEMYGDRDRVLGLFPSCERFYSGEDEHAVAVVDADMGGNAATVGSALVLSFGAALWLAVAIHMIGVEIYLMLTPAEHERLRNVSYQRQLEAGMKNPGRAGLTVDRFGDAEKWIPASQRRVGDEQNVTDDSDTAINER
ncbi:hypothetical protein MCOR25_002584 [Pyricularia grisea]|uniref:Microtubule associated protein n=1 Tax=Pyricularia grisea TaxID=148305 RepID=A0A6P8AYG8_PYRGI|nr:hypothetical protein PgNI_10486 [Pyricularia grisea]KAI6377329.1 hypothetical protein MCOR25_002584 [Pyricularia grisea]TLD07382.1 hypothetical protein PgNI_10486 [Pyricularia grisea]